MIPLTFMKFYPSDWRSGCANLTVTEEGLYIRCCAYMAEVGLPIPSDDHEAARKLRVNLLQYRKVMEALIGKGKLIRAQGVIINERVLEEMDKARLRSDAARKREANKKARLERMITEAIEKDRKARLEDHLAQHTPQYTPGYTPGLTPQCTPGCTPGLTPQYTPGYTLGLGEENLNEISGPPIREPRKQREKTPKNGVQSLELRVQSLDSGNISVESQSSIETQNPELPMSETGVSDVCSDDMSQGGEKPKSPSPKRKVYPQSFEAFWAAWIKARGGIRDHSDKAPAAKAWADLGADDRARAVEAVQLFWDDHRRQIKNGATHSPLHAERYLKRARYNTLLENQGEQRANQPRWQDQDKVAVRPVETTGEAVGDGVYLDDEAKIIRHREFAISMAAVEYHLATANIDLTPDQQRKRAREASIAHALQWAASIAAGKRAFDVLPRDPALLIRSAIVNQHNRDLTAKAARSKSKASILKRGHFA